MSDINNVTLIGRATRDAELKYTAAGTAVLNFSVAVNESRKQGDQWVEEVNFFDITLFGRMGESLKSCIVKGKQVAISGRLQQQRWETNGGARSRVIVVANSVQLLGGGNNHGAPLWARGQSDFQGYTPF